MPRRAVLALSTILAAVSGAQSGFAQCSAEKFVPFYTPGPSDYYGYSLSASAHPFLYEPIFLVGAWGYDSTDMTSMGWAYLHWPTIAQHTYINADDPQPGDFFGTSVGLGYPYAIVGATGVGDTGAAYIFDNTTSNWPQKAKLIPAGASAGDDVGRSVAITDAHGGWAMFGAPGVDQDFDGSTPGDSDLNCGLAYFVRQNAGVWSINHSVPLRLSITTPGGSVAGDRFGYAVDLEGDVAVAGAPEATLSGQPSEHGYVQVFAWQANLDTWNLGSEVTAPDAAIDDHFGRAVSTDGLRVAVGAPDDDATNAESGGAGAKTNSGSVYIFSKPANAWVLEAKVPCPGTLSNAYFGSSVCIDGDDLAVGAPNIKTAFRFRRVSGGQWVLAGKYTDPDDPASGSFAAEVAIKNSHIIVSDPNDDNTEFLTNAGAVYMFPADDDAPPDSCYEPRVIPGHGEYPGSTTCATLDGTTICGGGSPGFGPDVWYSWTPHCSGNVIIDTFGSDFDTVLSIHSACPGNGLNTLYCNDDSNSNVQSLLTFNYTAGTTYLIRVSGYGGDSGHYNLRVVDWYIPPNDSCASAQNVGNGSYQFTTCRATSAAISGATCGGNDPVNDVWFLYTAACSGEIRVSTCGSNFDTVLQVFDSACPAANSEAIACSDDSGTNCPASTFTSRVTFQARNGGQYRIRVGGASPAGPAGQFGDGVLTISCVACPCDWNQSGLLSVQDIFDFLASYFSGSGDFNASGATTVQDIFDFLACYFSGCA